MRTASQEREEETGHAALGECSLLPKRIAVHTPKHRNSPDFVLIFKAVSSFVM